MEFQQRLGIVGVLAIAALMIYGLGRYYSTALMAYVVEQTLIEKSPPGTDTAQLRGRFESFVSAARSPERKLQRLLRLSQYLEKVQELTRADLEFLLQEPSDESSTGALENPWNFFSSDNV